MHTLFEELLQKNKTDLTLPYLYRSCTNRCLNLLRDIKRRTEILKVAVPPSEPAPQTCLEEKTVNLDLLAALTAKLDKKSAEILVYRYFDDLGQEEIADLMGLSRKSVGKRLQKISIEAKKALNRAATTGGKLL